MEGSLGSDNPREVVLLLDLISFTQASPDDVKRVREAARLILQSLSAQDQVSGREGGRGFLLRSGSGE